MMNTQQLKKRLKSLIRELNKAIDTNTNFHLKEATENGNNEQINYWNWVIALYQQKIIDYSWILSLIDKEFQYKNLKIESDYEKAFQNFKIKFNIDVQPTKKIFPKTKQKKFRIYT